MSKSQMLIVKARARGYQEIINRDDKGRNRGIILNMCPKCDQKRLISFEKVTDVEGDALVDKCYGCGFKVAVKAEVKAPKVIKKATKKAKVTKAKVKKTTKKAKPNIQDEPMTF